MQTTLIDIQSLMQLRNCDAPWYAENMWCDTCDTWFEEDVQWIGKGKYLAFCHRCKRPEQFSNADILALKCEDDHYWMVKQLVEYNIKNKIEMITASVSGGWWIDGAHRTAAAIELGMKLIIVDDREEPIVDHPYEWAARSPAFTIDKSGKIEASVI